MLLSVSPSVSAKTSVATALMLTSMKPKPIPLVNCDTIKTAKEGVQGMKMPARDISANPIIRRYFEFSLPVNAPAIRTPTVNPKADNVNEKPATSSGTCVCCASNGNEAPGRTLRIPVQIYAQKSV